MVGVSRLSALERFIYQPLTQGRAKRLQRGRRASGELPKSPRINILASSMPSP